MFRKEKSERPKKKTFKGKEKIFIGRSKGRGEREVTRRE
jgi:hypothetical protein